MEEQRARPPRITAAVLMLIGLYLAGGGLWLLVLGGSPYYVVAGLLVLASGALIWMGRPLGATIFELTFVATLLWALWEVGAQPWQLAPRVLPMLVIAIWLYTPWIRRGLHPPGEDDDASGESGPGVKRAAAAIAIAVIGTGALISSQLWADDHPSEPPLTTADRNWTTYGHTLAGTRFSALQQINEDTVAKLKPAWVFHTGDLPDAGDAPVRGFAMKATPIEVDGTLYVCTPHDRVFALDATDGKEMWRHDWGTAKKHLVGDCRGVAYARTAEAGVCARRIYGVTADARLYALDAETGKPCPGFGTAGTVTLAKLPAKTRFQSAPPTVVHDMILVSGVANAGPGRTEGNSALFAFDARNGHRLWHWSAAPAGADITAPVAVDPDLGIVYVATGSPARGTDSRYASALVALDLAHGTVKWSFQTAHGDVWNYGLTAPPVLATLPSPEGPIPAVIQATKRGDIFVLDRRSGKPVVKTTERKAGASAQPFSQISFTPPPLKGANMWGLTPLDQLACRIRFREATYRGLFTPPVKGKPSLVYPGGRGLIDWGGIAVDTDNTLIIANTSRMPSYEYLVTENGKTRVHREPFLGPLHIPCTAPPWGFLDMVDLKTDRYIWHEPIGSAAGVGPLGIPTLLPFTVGLPNEAGTIVTRGNVIFAAGTLDNTLRAYDLFTGKVLWKTRLPAGGQATPMTYQAGGKQYVVISAGGDAEFHTHTGDAVMAYTLP